MSLFITKLSFADELLQEEAKIVILIATLISYLLGFTVLKSAIKNPEAITRNNIKSKD
ncbi:MAG: Na+/H+ antiporter NhaA [Flavobacteriaceae bacterium]